MDNSDEWALVSNRAPIDTQSDTLTVVPLTQPKFKLKFSITILEFATYQNNN